MKNMPVGPLSRTGGTAVRPSSPPTGSPSHAHQFLKAALSACKRAALSMQKGSFERLKGLRLLRPSLQSSSIPPTIKSKSVHLGNKDLHVKSQRSICIKNIKKNKLTRPKVRVFIIILRKIKPKHLQTSTLKKDEKEPIALFSACKCCRVYNQCPSRRVRW